MEPVILSEAKNLIKEKNMNCAQDIEYMQRAMTLAENGRGFVNPNPLVGAVIVMDGRVIGEGWHRKYGCLHAEREALAACTEDPAGSTMYVTLEPCCHYGKQPPCTEAIIAAGISRVVVGLPDPNPLVAGKGIAILKEHGIDVECGLLEADLKYQNRVFLKYITTHRPWVTMKWAMTLDGKIAAASGDSKWVSSAASRQFVHELRGKCTGILAGIGTVLADDPMLNCRAEGYSQPVRIIVDSHASLPLDSAIVRTAGEYRTVLACTEPESSSVSTSEYVSASELSGACHQRLEALRNAGVELLGCTADAGGRVDFRDLFKKLGEAGIDSVLAEGGAEVNWSLVRDGLADEFYFFIAPKIIGGRTAKGPVGGGGFPLMSDALQLSIDSVTNCGDDLLIHAYNSDYRRAVPHGRIDLTDKN